MFVSQLCGARSVQCVCVDVKMIVQVFVSSVVAVMVGELCFVFLIGGLLDGERNGHSRPEVLQFGVFQDFLVWENGHVWANAERRSRDEALRMVVDVAGGAD